MSLFSAETFLLLLVAAAAAVALLLLKGFGAAGSEPHVGPDHGGADAEGAAPSAGHGSAAAALSEPNAPASADAAPPAADAEAQASPGGNGAGASPAPDRPPAPAPAEAPASLSDPERPPALAEPVGGQADDLRRIRGIGPQNESRLRDLGIFHYHQIAAWTDREVEWVSRYLAFPGRVAREEWVAKAKALLAAGGPDAALRPGEPGRPDGMPAGG